MSTGIVIAIVVIAAIVFGLIVVLTTSRTTEVRGAGALSRETRSRNAKTTISDAAPSGREVEAQAAVRSTSVVKAAPVELAPWVAPDEEALGVSRRMFFNRATITLFTVSLGAFGASVVGFLWKGAEGGFGTKINAGKVDDVIQLIRQNKGFLYLSEARAWVTEYPKDAIGKGKTVYGGQAPVYSGMQAGIVALYQNALTLVVEFLSARARSGLNVHVTVLSTIVLVKKGWPSTTRYGSFWSVHCQRCSHH